MTLSENDTTYSVIDIFLILFCHLLLLLLNCAQRWMLLMIDYIYLISNVCVCVCDILISKFIWLKIHFAACFSPKKLLSKIVPSSTVTVRTYELTAIACDATAIAWAHIE